MRIQPRQKLAFRVAYIVALVTLAALLGAGFLRALYMQARITPGVVVGGVHVGGKKLPEARLLLERHIQNNFSTVELVSQVSEKASLRISLESLGGSILLDEALEKAMAAGTSRPAPEQAKRIFAKKVQPIHIPLLVSFDNEELTGALATHFGGTLERPAENARVEFDGRRARVVPAKDGGVIDRTSLKDELASDLAQSRALQIPLRTIPNEPRFATTQAQELVSRIERILAAAPYELAGAGTQVRIPRNEVGRWLVIQEDKASSRLVFADMDIEERLLTIAPAFSRESVDVMLGIGADGRAVVARPSEDALRLNVAKTGTALREALGAAHKRVEAVFDATPAHINERILQERGITHLVGKGESDFGGSSASRVQNIRVASEKYRGVFLEPGQEFSFVAHLGDIDAKGGYVPELVIKNKKLVKEYGGGICQVSTTMFRAAVMAGLKITERVPHSIPVRYYNPQGFDATVYPPNPDLKFVNNTTSTLFIQPRIEGTKLAFELYGTPDGRKVVLDGPRVVERTVDGGLKTVLTRKVYMGESVIEEKKFWSFYRPPLTAAAERNPLE